MVERVWRRICDEEVAGSTPGRTTADAYTDCWQIALTLVSIPVTKQYNLLPVNGR